MEPLAALLLMVGCSEDLARCEELPAPVPFYQSVERCEQDMNGAFADFSDRYPQLYAQCVSFDEGLATGDAALVWEIAEGGHLVASVEPADEGDFEIASATDPRAEALSTP